MKQYPQKTKSLKVGQFLFTVRNMYEFFTIYKSIFWFHEYKFSAASPKPFIIDCGAHIGVSVLYFKKLYSKAKVLAFEPNPDSFALLKKNVVQNHLQDVTLVNKAVSDKAGKTKFYASNGKNGSVSIGDSIVPNPWISKHTHDQITVDTVKLSDFIRGPVDLVKIDVEGMEGRVLKEIQGKMHFIRRIIFEFHGNKKNRQNRYADIIRLLHDKGFTVHTYFPSSLMRPFRREVASADIDETGEWILIVYAVNDAIVR